MVDLRYLSVGEVTPEAAHDVPWMIVEASQDGRYFGTGYGVGPSGKDVFYISLPENDVSLDAALGAAKKWAAEHGVACIWVQISPS